MQISDKWKAVVAAFGVFATTFVAAAEDSTVTIQEGGGIVLAAFAVGAAVWAVRNRTPA